MFKGVVGGSSFISLLWDFSCPTLSIPTRNSHIKGGYLAVQLENNPYSYLKIASRCQNGHEPTQAASTLVRTWLLET